MLTTGLIFIAYNLLNIFVVNQMTEILTGLFNQNPSIISDEDVTLIDFSILFVKCIDFNDLINWMDKIWYSFCICLQFYDNLLKEK